MDGVGVACIAIPLPRYWLWGVRCVWRGSAPPLVASRHARLEAPTPSDDSAGRVVGKASLCFGLDGEGMTDEVKVFG